MRLTAENQRLTQSLRDVRQRKDERINELVRKLDRLQREWDEDESWPPPEAPPL
jgi:hypothetical protein